MFEAMHKEYSRGFPYAKDCLYWTYENAPPFPEPLVEVWDWTGGWALSIAGSLIKPLFHETAVD